jgi:hypothetical protein
MRADAVGFFWNDAPVPKPPKPDKEKRQPPERTWERADYLPGIEEARRFPVELFTDHTLMSEIGNELVCDVECYTNYFEVGFMSLKTGRVAVFVMTTEQPALDLQRIHWITQNFTLVTFNGNHYDMPMLAFALAGHDCKVLKQISDAIIVYQEAPWQIMRMWKVKKLRCDHVDIKEVCPLMGGLKAYAGRIGAPKMQDLPFNPATWLTPDQQLITTWYNVNDMVNTAYVHSYLKEPLELRAKMSSEYGIDLRSKSDAQIAEAVIAMQIESMTGRRPSAPDIPVGTVYRYNVPPFLQFRTAGMQHAVDIVRNTMFVVGDDGRIAKPPELEGLQVQIADMTYTLGIGGLHSTEKSISHRAVGGYKIKDIDMASFYPYIMLNQGLYPEHLGADFLMVFRRIVDRRIAAKKAGDKATANSLKITINGTYGKLGSPYSIIYAPDKLTQTTLTGQLAILMLIEWLETYGIQVISANTDGIAVKYHESKEGVVDHVVAEWSKVVDFVPEDTHYLAMYNKDVNNYIAVKTDGTCKTKGIYSNPWNDKKDVTDHLKKNPTGQVCIDAIEALLTKSVPLETSIRECKDLRKFMFLRRVKYGAVKDGEFLGTIVRWYYAVGSVGEIISAGSGHTVPMSEGAKPCMELPASLPNDINYDWYIQRAERHLRDIGYYG